MGFKKRMKMAKEKMRELARVKSVELGERPPTEYEWYLLKKEAHQLSVLLSHQVYDASRGVDSGFGHNERQEIRRELKKTFFNLWNYLRKKVEKRQQYKSEKRVYKPATPSQSELLKREAIKRYGLLQPKELRKKMKEIYDNEIKPLSYTERTAYMMK